MLRLWLPYNKGMKLENDSYQHLRRRIIGNPILTPEKGIDFVIFYVY